MNEAAARGWMVDDVDAVTGGALPNLVVIGAMKCGTTSLHRYLDAHPDVAMSEPKELNFFTGRARGTTTGARFDHGTWHLGPDWYAGRFPATATVRGETSPAYTSPDHPEVGARMAATVPDATLVMCIRDPLERALSQHRHHQREGDERRPAEEALLDPGSQYVSRGRYHERLRPFADRFGWDRIELVEHDELRTRPREVVARILGRFSLDPPGRTGAFEVRWNHGGGQRAPVPRSLRERFADAVRDDVERLRAATDQHLWPWI